LPAKIPATGRNSKITVGDVIRAAEIHATERTLPAGARAGTRVHNWPTSKIPPWAPKFLDALVWDPNVSRAAAIAGIGRQHAYTVRGQNPTFAAFWDEAVEIATDALESAVRRRAMDGVPRPIYQGGKLAGFVREHSDQLAALLLKAHRPQKYRENYDLRHFGIPATPPPQVSVEVDFGKIFARRLAEVAAEPSAPGLPADERFARRTASPLFTESSKREVPGSK
jgi:hypothetical protein